MANRHSHKKLRAEIRAWMARTGENYQKARHRLLEHRVGRQDGADLIAITYFGVPVTVATFEGPSHIGVVLVSGAGGPLALPWGKPPILYSPTRGVLQ